MSFIKYAAPVAAAMMGVASAADGCTFTAATTISAAGDVSSLAGCSTISGDIVFATGAAAPTLSLAGVEEIDGDITYETDSAVSSFEAPMLKKISGKILLNNLTALNDLMLNSIQTTGDVTITNCPKLTNVVTGTQYSEAGVLTLGNTYLSELAGFGNLTSLEALSISGNPLLSDITMNINSVKSIDIGSNEEANQGLNVRFDNLTMALDYITVQNATNVSFANLDTVVNNLALIFNNFQTFSAPNLTTAGGLVLDSNPSLTNISLPALTMLNGTKGTFEIANNTNLLSVSGFPKLTTCSGSVKFLGNFKNVTLDGFKRIAGAMTVGSTADITDVCNEVNTLHNQQVILGAKTCNSGDPSANNTISGSGSGKGGSSTSSDAAIPLSIPALPSLSAGLGVALLQFLLSF